MMQTRGFTLLEIVLATSILAGLAATTFSWIATMGRFQQKISQRLETILTAEAIASAIREDLIQELTSQPNDRFSIHENRLEVTTLNDFPGDPPGVHRVVWRQDDKIPAIIREFITSDPDLKNSLRIVSRDLELVRFVRVGTTGPLSLVFRSHRYQIEHQVPLTLAGAP